MNDSQEVNINHIWGRGSFFGEHASLQEGKDDANDAADGLD
jgi:hypothetical protein